MDQGVSSDQDGLRFECTRCQRCCRIEPGYVFLSAKDIERLSAVKGLPPDEIVGRFCCTVDVAGIDRISLREEENYDCVFWEEGACVVYESRPLQCESFPFWDSNVQSQESWDEAAQMCPGVGRGPLHSFEELKYWLNRRLEEPPVSISEVE